MSTEMITQALRLVCGTETIWLSEAGVNLTSRFIPMAPDGEDVTDTAEVSFTVNDNNRILLNKINRLFVLAKHYQDAQVGKRVYIEFQPNKGETFYRSEVLAGQVVLNNADAPLRISDNALEANIFIQHVPYWEGPETQLPLTNVVDYRNTSGLTVFNPALFYQANTFKFFNATSVISDTANHMDYFPTGEIITVVGSVWNDGTYLITEGGELHNDHIVVGSALTNENVGGPMITLISQARNFVDIAADDIDGDMPAPLMVSIENDFNDPDKMRNVFIAQNVFSNPTTFNHILEGELGVPVVADVVVSDAACSKGEYRQLTFTSTTGTDLVYWAISGAQWLLYAGNYFRFLLRLQDDPGYADLWFKLSIRAGLAADPMNESEWFQFSSGELFEGAMMRLMSLFNPAWTVMPGYDLVLVGKRTTGAAAVVKLDYVQISPLDGWKKLISVDPAGGCDYSLTILSDDINNGLYTIVNGPTGANFTPYYFNYYTSSALLKVYPQMLNRLYFLHDCDDETSQPFRHSKIKIWYRPRRSTL